MKGKMFIGSISFLCFVVLLSLLFTEARKTFAETIPVPEIISIGGISGTGVVLIGGLAAEIEKKMSKRATTTKGLGSTAITKLILKNTMQFGIIPPDTAGLAYAGKRQFSKMGPRPIRVVQPTHMVWLTLIARANSGIESVNDLKNKKFMFSSKRALSLESYGRLLMKLKGWTERQMPLFGHSERMPLILRSLL